MAERRFDRGVIRDAAARDGADCAPVRVDPLLEQMDFVADLILAMTDKDGRAVRALLRQPFASRLPRELIAEALLFSKLPTDSHRAPLHALQFAHRLEQLHLGAGSPSDPFGAQLEFDLMDDGQDSRPW